MILALPHDHAVCTNWLTLILVIELKRSVVMFRASTRIAEDKTKGRGLIITHYKTTAVRYYTRSDWLDYCTLLDASILNADMCVVSRTEQ